jgi:hypothetical protein
MESEHVLMLTPIFFVQAFDALVDPSLEYRGFLSHEKVIPISRVTPPSADRPPYDTKTRRTTRWTAQKPAQRSAMKELEQAVSSTENISYGPK